MLKQGHNSVVAELDLNGFDDELAILSGRTANVELLDAIRAEVGDNVENWLPFSNSEGVLADDFLSTSRRTAQRGAHACC